MMRQTHINKEINTLSHENIKHKAESWPRCAIYQSLFIEHAKKT